jgi:response regulator RpfG family c-di-GMP phosphodiesterase
VDDEPLNLSLLEAILVPRGYEVVKAVNGRQALERVAERPVDLILLDVMMPLMNGFEFCRTLKSDKRRTNIPVVMITALDTKEDRIRSIEAGAEDFISKPFDQEEVLARISMLLKMKSLNDRLADAYSHITRLTAFGEELIHTFDPFNFDFMTKVDSIVSQIIRREDDAAGKPEAVLVRLLSGDGRLEWHHYTCNGSGLQRSPLKRNLPAEFPGGITTFSFNSSIGNGPEHQAIIRGLAAFNLPVRNCVAHLSDSLSIFALNYGRDVGEYETAILDSLVMQSLFLRSLSHQIRETEEGFAYTIHALARAAEANDEATGNHVIRVAEYSGLVAERLGMTEEFVREIRLKAQLHDVGKIHTAPNLLKKPGELTVDEVEEIRKHTIFGARIIGDHPRLRMARNIALTHHEKWDGSGYPYGLRGEQIPVEGRILAVADQYDALRNPRVYKSSFDHETTCRIITEGDGRTLPVHFDPTVLRVFHVMAARFKEVYEELRN